MMTTIGCLFIIFAPVAKDELTIENPVITEGIVINNVKTIRKDMETKREKEMFLTEFEYRDLEQNKLVLRSNNASGRPTELGKKFEIKYNRENSKEALVNSGLEGFFNNYIHIILTTMGGMLLISPAISLFKKIKKSRH